MLIGDDRDMSNLIVRNIGTIVTGDYYHPVAEGDTLCAQNGKIVYVGDACGAPALEYDLEVDAVGLTLCPGLIDAHAHPPMSNYLNMYKAYDWVDNYAAAGITSLVSVGAIRFPGVAQDATSAKVQALCSKSIWDNYHPSFVKVHANSVMLYKDMVEEDFAMLSSYGIRILGEVGMSEVKDVNEAARLVSLAKKHGLVTTLHCAAPSTLDCASYTLDEIEEIAPDVLCHINGSPTPLDTRWVQKLVESGKYWFDCISNGSETLLLQIARWAKEAGTLDKMMLGTNVPSMSGFSPMGLWIQMAAISQNSEIDPATVVCMASGNVARCYGLDHGIIAPGMQADFLLASTGSIMPDMLSTLAYGRVPSVAGSFVDGAQGLTKCKNMAPPKKRPVVFYAR